MKVFLDILSIIVLFCAGCYWADGEFLKFTVAFILFCIFDVDILEQMQAKYNNLSFVLIIILFLIFNLA